MAASLGTVETEGRVPEEWRQRRVRSRYHPAAAATAAAAAAATAAVSSAASPETERTATRPSRSPRTVAVQVEFESKI
jgi:hypothetical protein